MALLQHYSDDLVHVARFSDINCTSKIVLNLLSAPDLFDVVEDVDDVAVPSRRLFDLACQGEAGHGHDVEGQPDQRLCVVKPLEQHTPCGHCDLKISDDFFSKQVLLRLMDK